jgi:hypothetical protein
MERKLMRLAAQTAFVAAVVCGCGDGGNGDTPPAITVLSPDGAGTWSIGQSADVTWSTEGTIGDVTIELSTNGGTDWTTLVASTGNDGAESVTVPDTPSAQCRVRVSELDGDPSDVSDGDFTIEPAPTITVLSPDGTETWVAGTSADVTWTSTGTVGDVKIELSTDSGGGWTTLVPSTANDGTETLTVPDSPGTQCRIRVAELDDDPTDMSNGDFTIEPAPAITVTSPGNGDEWAAGGSADVTWTSEGSVGDVMIELSTNGGTGWTTLVASTVDDGAETVNVPSTLSDQCVVKVSETDGSPSDTSEGLFSIVTTPDSITVTAPNTYVLWNVGTIYQITWDSVGTIPDVKIEVSRDNGGEVGGRIVVIGEPPVLGGGRRHEPGEALILRLDAGDVRGPADAPGQALGVRPVGPRAADAAAVRGPERRAGVLLGDVLVDAVGGEAGDRLAAGGQQPFKFHSVLGRERGGEDRAASVPAEKRHVISRSRRTGHVRLFGELRTPCEPGILDELRVFDKLRILGGVHVTDGRRLRGRSRARRRPGRHGLTHSGSRRRRPVSGRIP